MSKVVKILQCKCPNCNDGDIYKNDGNILILKFPKMNQQCPTCHYKFEREPGYFFGAMYVSYGLAVAEMIASLIIFWHLFNLSPLMVFCIITILTFLLAGINFKLSRSVWIHMFFKTNNDY